MFHENNNNECFIHIFAVKVMFLDLSVILFSPQADNPPRQTLPLGRHHPDRHIPNPPRQTSSGRHPHGQTPLQADPPSLGDCHCSGRYASYWNAFLFSAMIKVKFLLVKCELYFNTFLFRFIFTSREISK